MAKAKRKAARLLIFPDDAWIKAARKKLPKFKPHDFRSLVDAAKKSDATDTDKVFILEIRRRNERQLIDLLQSLGVDPLRPDAWARGFLLLAIYHHGVSHIAWSPLRTNRNATTWTPENDFNLLREITISQGRGLSQRQAVKRLAADRTKWQLFPYQPKGHFVTGSEQRKREAALWARLRAIVKRSRGRSLLDLFGLSEQPATNSIEDTLRRLDMVNSLPALVKNGSLSEEADS